MAIYFSVSIFLCVCTVPGSADNKASSYNVGDPGSIAGSGRSPGEGNGHFSILAWKTP